MKIDREWLIKKSACADGIDWFEAQKRTDGIEILQALIQENKLDWANWLIVRIMNYFQYVKYAVYAAEQVIDIFEAQYPDDQRPRQAIEAAKKCIKNPSKKNRLAMSIARSMAFTASPAAYAAFAAAYAAFVGGDVAEAKDYAALAASAAANAKAGLEKKILIYGISLIEKKEE